MTTHCRLLQVQKREGITRARLVNPRTKQTGSGLIAVPHLIVSAKKKAAEMTDGENRGNSSALAQAFNQYEAPETYCPLSADPRN